MAIDDFMKQAEAMRGLLGDIGVTDDDYKRARKAKSAEVQSLLQVPKHYTTAMREEMGTGKFLGKAFFGEMAGPLAAMFAPEYAAKKALYGEEIKSYAKQRERLAVSGAADPFREMLQNDTTDDDLNALENLAVLYPDVYGKVLQKFQTNRLAPDAPTYTEGGYQFDPDYTDREGQVPGRWYLERQASDGSSKREYRSPDFTPTSRKPTADYIDKSIGKADDEAYRANSVVQETTGIIGRMDEIGSDNWLAGYAGKGSEFIKNAMGTEDFVTAVRKQYSDIKVRSAINNLPPGVASDKDIALVLEPWPEDTSNFQLIRDKLEAIRKVEEGRAAYSAFESNYLATKGSRSGLQSAWLQTPRGSATAKANQAAKEPRYKVITQ
jgi:hypothetical protein